MHPPLNADPNDRQWSPHGSGNRILVTGVAGAAVTLTAQQLGATYDLVGVGLRPPSKELFDEIHVMDLADAERPEELVSTADYVLHLATGANDGVAGVQSVEVDATSRILASAIAHGTRRVVLASSTHAVGWHERELIAGRGDGVVLPYMRRHVLTACMARRSAHGTLGSVSI